MKLCLLLVQLKGYSIAMYVRAEGFHLGSRGREILWIMITNMAEPIQVKFSGIIEDFAENNLAKEFVGKN